MKKAEFDINFKRINPQEGHAKLNGIELPNIVDVRIDSRFMEAPLVVLTMRATKITFAEDLQMKADDCKHGVSMDQRCNLCVAL